MPKDVTHELVLEIYKVTTDTNDKLSHMDKTLALNTQALEEHMRRTDILEGMIQPVYQERLAKAAVEEYKKEQRSDLLFKLKLPAYIVAAVTATATLIAWLKGII